MACYWNGDWFCNKTVGGEMKMNELTKKKENYALTLLTDDDEYIGKKQVYLVSDVRLAVEELKRRISSYEGKLYAELIINIDDVFSGVKK